jgi:hypothetical protein
VEKLFSFGEDIPGFEIPVLNEREVRAAAGIVFLFAFIAFMNAYLTGNNDPTKLMVSIFLLDFFIRIFLNPKYAPSMVLGRWMVNKQTPEYVGAAQKRWAWAIGFLLASIMFYLVVLNNVRGPINILTCALCLGLLFFESVFGICAGCKLYKLFHKEHKMYCPGDSCDLSRNRHKIQNFNPLQRVIFALSIAALLYLAFGSTINFIFFI